MTALRNNKNDLFTGFASVMICLLSGMIINDPYGVFYDTPIEDFLFELPAFIAFTPFVGVFIVNIVFAVIGALKRRNTLFMSAIITTGLSFFSYILFSLTPNDDNPIIVLFMLFTLVFCLFGVGFEASFSNIEFMIYDYEHLYFFKDETALYITLLVTIFVIPAIVYPIVKWFLRKHDNFNDRNSDSR